MKKTLDAKTVDDLRAAALGIIAKEDFTADESYRDDVEPSDGEVYEVSVWCEDGLYEAVAYETYIRDDIGDRVSGDDYIQLLTDYRPEPGGDGIKLTREQAEELLNLRKRDPRLTVMCYEYGADNCDECDGPCTCWSEVTIDDLDEDGHLDDDLVHFELWIDAPRSERMLPSCICCRELYDPDVEWVEYRPEATVCKVCALRARQFARQAQMAGKPLTWRVVSPVETDETLADVTTFLQGVGVSAYVEVPYSELRPGSATEPAKPRPYPVCAECGSDDLILETLNARWDADRGIAEATEVCDGYHTCDGCDRQDVRLRWVGEEDEDDAGA